VFHGLEAGEYTLFVEARGINNSQDVAFDIVGPISLVAGVNSTEADIASKPKHTSTVMTKVHFSL